MENVKEIIAQNLVSLRKSRRMTQQELAEKLNYSDKAISRWEHAETLPDIETLCKVCEIYGVKFEYLLQKEQKQDYMPSGRSGLISHAIEAIERDFTNPDLTVSNLAALCGISEVYFRKIFIHGFGVSPKEYIIRKRMEYAIQLLELGEFEVSRVAALCGYTEPCHFSREFKKRFGIVPKKYLFNKGNRDNTFTHRI